MASETKVRQVLPGLTFLFYVASALVLLAALQLFVLSSRTDQFFAWTIAVPLTAAVDGAFYLAAFFLLFPATRGRTWAEVTPISWGVLAVSIMKLAATLLHTGLFHFHEGETTARIAAWGWLAVYVVVPVALAALIVAELRTPGADPPARDLMTRPFRWVAGVLSAALLVTGLGLLSASAAFITRWPWPLTPLTSQALSAWFVGIGIVAGLAVRDGDRFRTRHVWAGALILGLLQGVALLRYGSAVDWSSPYAWVYLALFVVVGLVGVWGLLMLRSATSRGDGHDSAAARAPGA
ncbi:MAG TPA: hypothetical protein VEM41_02715 [Actinomycetota bacterium]|nr:hypothetical protein [Actinomycetota bacterium]